MPSSTLTARPVTSTRSPFASTPTVPERGDAWKPFSAFRPSRSTQYEARTTWALPVTGSSSMPTLGPKTRETKSYGRPGSAGAVTITASASSRATAAMSATNRRTDCSPVRTAIRKPFALLPVHSTVVPSASTRGVADRSERELKLGSEWFAYLFVREQTALR